MEQLFMELEKMESVSCGDDYMHIITADGDKIIKISDLAKAITDGEFIKAGANGKIGFITDNPDKGLRNSIFRGKCLGDSLTAEQAAAIKAGTFQDMFVGDYWTIGVVNYRIAHLDYWLRCGDAECTKHHAVIVPDTCLRFHFTSVRMAKIENSGDSRGWQGYGKKEHSSIVGGIAS